MLRGMFSKTFWEKRAPNSQKYTATLYVCLLWVRVKRIALYTEWSYSHRTPTVYAHPDRRPEQDDVITLIKSPWRVFRLTCCAFVGCRPSHGRTFSGGQRKTGSGERVRKSKVAAITTKYSWKRHKIQQRNWWAKRRNSTSMEFSSFQNDCFHFVCTQPNLTQTLPYLPRNFLFPVSR